MSRLCDLKEGETAQVLTISPGCELRRRLMDIGLIPGSLVECIGRSPAGDPTAYLIKGAVIAIRARDAVNVEVAPWS